MLRHCPTGASWIVGLLCLVFTGLAPAAPPDPAKAADVGARGEEAALSKFLRIQRDAEDQAVALETSIVRYVPAEGDKELVVDLISVVHLADRPYYKQLNEHFEQYDAVLYELVAPPGAEVPRPQQRAAGNPLSFLQQMMKTMLGLELQTEHIDYSKENFVHADLSPQEMAEAMRRRGDSGLTVLMKIVSETLDQHRAQQQRQAQRRDPGLNPFALLFDPRAPVKLKRQMAEQFESLDAAGGLGQTLNTILITDRNKAAIAVLRKNLDRGKTRIGIFYGAAHMPDFEDRLLADFGLKQDRVQWLTAWDLQLENEKAVPAEEK